MTNETPLPSIGAPAKAALANIGIETLACVAALTEKEVTKLHGVGPKAIGILRQALADHGLTFKAD